jgi:hypothetical protein
MLTVLLFLLTAATAMLWDVRDDGYQDAINPSSERVRCSLLNSVWKRKQML